MIMISTGLERRSYKKSNPIARFSRVVGAALLSPLPLLSAKGRQPSTSPSLVTGAERKNMSRIFFAERNWLFWNCREGHQHLVVNSISQRNHGFNGSKTDFHGLIRPDPSQSVKSVVSSSFSESQDVGVSHGNSQRPKKFGYFLRILKM
jgi:hypothetical protein